MTRYRITNTQSGADLGAYDATSKADALDQMARDAGYANYGAIPAEIAGGEHLSVTRNATADEFFSDDVSPPSFFRSDD